MFTLANAKAKLGHLVDSHASDEFIRRINEVLERFWGIGTYWGMMGLREVTPVEQDDQLLILLDQKETLLGLQDKARGRPVTVWGLFNEFHPLGIGRVNKDTGIFADLGLYRKVGEDGSTGLQITINDRPPDWNGEDPDPGNVALHKDASGYYVYIGNNADGKPMFQREDGYTLAWPELWMFDDPELFSFLPACYSFYTKWPVTEPSDIIITTHADNPAGPYDLAFFNGQSFHDKENPYDVVLISFVEETVASESFTLHHAYKVPAPATDYWALVKLAPFEVLNDTDEIPVSNIGALKLGILASNYEDHDNIDKADQYWARAKKILDDELAMMRAGTTNPPPVTPEGPGSYESTPALY